MAEDTSTSRGMNDFIQRGTISEIAREINKLKKITRDLVNASNIVPATPVPGGSVPIGEGNTVATDIFGLETIIFNRSDSMVYGNYITLDIYFWIWFGFAVPGDLIRIKFILQNGTFGPATLTGDFVYPGVAGDYIGHIVIYLTHVTAPGFTFLVMDGLVKRVGGTEIAEFSTNWGLVDDITIPTDFTVTAQIVSADPFKTPAFKLASVFTKYPLV